MPDRPTLPAIPAGTRLTLQPDDWYSKPGVRAMSYLDLRVVALLPGNADAAWVYGHDPACTADCTEPCKEVRVSIGALLLVADRLATRR